MTLTTEQKRLVRSTWALVMPIQDEAARLFYGRLFEIDPSTKPLFTSTDMAEQGKKLKVGLVTDIGGLNAMRATGSKKSITRAWARPCCGRWSRGWEGSSRPR